MASNIDLTGERSSYQAAFAFDVITAAVALTLLALASRPTFQRIKARRFSIASKDRPLPLKTSLGTYLFLYPGLIFIFITYTLDFVADLLKTSGTIEYDGGLVLHGNRPFSNSAYGYSIAILSLVSELLSIFFTVLLNGGVWIYSSHTLANGTGRQAPSLKSKIYNTLIMLAMLATGLAAWGLGVSVRSRSATWASTVEDHQTTRTLYVVYRAVVVAASISVSVQVAKEYLDCNKHSSRDVSISRTSKPSTYFSSADFITSRQSVRIWPASLLWLCRSSGSGTHSSSTTSFCFTSTPHPGLLPASWQAVSS